MKNEYGLHGFEHPFLHELRWIFVKYVEIKKVSQRFKVKTICLGGHTITRLQKV